MGHFLWWAHPVYHRVLSGILDLHPPDDNNTPLLLGVTTQTIFRHCPVSPGGQQVGALGTLTLFSPPQFSPPPMCLRLGVRGCRREKVSWGSRSAWGQKNWVRVGSWSLIFSFGDCLENSLYCPFSLPPFPPSFTSSLLPFPL